MTCPRSARYAGRIHCGRRALAQRGRHCYFGSVAAPMLFAARLQGDNHILVAEQMAASSAW